MKAIKYTRPEASGSYFPDSIMVSRRWTILFTWRRWKDNW